MFLKYFARGKNLENESLCPFECSSLSRFEIVKYEYDIMTIIFIMTF